MPAQCWNQEVFMRDVVGPMTTVRSPRDGSRILIVCVCEQVLAVFSAGSSRLANVTETDMRSCSVVRSEVTCSVQLGVSKYHYQLDDC
jgi:hypothetical protein